MNNNETRPGDPFGSLSREQREELAKKYPWFDSVRKSITAQDKLPAHISMQRAVHPGMIVPAQHDAIPEPGAAAVTGKQPIEGKQERIVPGKDTTKGEKEVRVSGKPAEKSPAAKGRVEAKEAETRSPNGGEAGVQPSKPAETAPVLTEPAGEKSRKDTSTIEIIDTFIDKGEHKIVPNDNTPDKLPADEGSMLPVDDELITEELAAIYMDQELFAQAIAIYERLSLLYPKKSVYFAEIIETAKVRMGEDSGQ